MNRTFELESILLLGQCLGTPGTRIKFIAHFGNKNLGQIKQQSMEGG